MAKIKMNQMYSCIGHKSLCNVSHASKKESLMYF